jgi:hypothetical protein
VCGSLKPARVTVGILHDLILLDIIIIVIIKIGIKNTQQQKPT